MTLQQGVRSGVDELHKPFQALLQKRSIGLHPIQKRACQLEGIEVGFQQPVDGVVQDRQLSQRQRGLALNAAEHDRVNGALISAVQMLEQSRSTNSAIATAMADIRSSSAVLTEVRQLVPELISLDQLEVDGNVLEISGSAQQPNGLRLVNALLLRLSASGFFAPKRVKLLQADVTRRADQATIRFSLSATFAPDAGLAMRTSLPLLGAEGMARRMEVLAQEGLLK
mgnify:CR=1 FL=1